MFSECNTSMLPTAYCASETVSKKYISDFRVIYTILPKVLGHPVLMKSLTTLVISMSTNLNV